MTNLDSPSPRPKLTKLRPSPKVTVHVTEEVIGRAVRADSTACMIADAIKEQVPGARSVSVDLQSIRWTDPTKGLRYIYLTPSNAQGALIMFDQGMAMEPFTVRLRSAHVTRSHTQLPHVPRIGQKKAITDEERAEKEQAKANRAALMADRRARAEAEGRIASDGRVIGDPIQMPSGKTEMAQEDGGGSVPSRRGGSAQPVGALPAKVRAFGARALKPPNPQAIGKPGSWVDPASKRPEHGSET